MGQMDAATLTVVFSAVGTVMAAIFAAGIAWGNFRYMRKNMVTRKDLELAIGEFYKEMEKKFVTREVCDLMMSNHKSNGQAKGMGR